MTHSRLILPGDIEFDLALATIPPNWKEVAAKSNTVSFLADAETGLLRAASGKECQEYLLGGEYQQRLESMWEYEDEDEHFHVEDLEGVEEFYIDW